jgi:hypothetical protein
MSVVEKPKAQKKGSKTYVPKPDNSIQHALETMMETGISSFIEDVQYMYLSVLELNNMPNRSNDIVPEYHANLTHRMFSMQNALNAIQSELEKGGRHE